MNNLPYDQDLQYQLWWLIRHVRWAMHRARAKELQQYGINTEDASVLFAVNAIGEEATPAKISRFVMREAHSVSGQIARMEKRGLVTKTKDLGKRNWVRISRRRPPIALRTPISRVRSVTDTNMIFIIPIPPTINETSAMDARSMVNVSVVSPSVDITSVIDRILKSFSKEYLILNPEASIGFRLRYNYPETVGYQLRILVGA